MSARRSVPRSAECSMPAICLMPPAMCRWGLSRWRSSRYWARAELRRPGSSDFLIPDQCEHRAEGDARQLQRRALEIDHVAAGDPLQRQRDLIGTEQRLEAGVVIMPLRRNLGRNRFAVAVVVAEERKGRV